MYDLVTLGDIVFDTIMVPKDITLMCPYEKRKNRNCFAPVLCLPYGEKVEVSQVHFSLGGSAANVAVGLARQGFQVGFISTVGKDEKSKKMVAQLEAEGVKTNYLKKNKDVVASFSLVILYGKERTILIYRGLEDYNKIILPPSLRSQWLFVGPLGKGYQSLYQKMISLAAEKNLRLALNPGKLQIQEEGALKELLRVVKVVILNRSEASEFCRAPSYVSVKELLKEIKEMGPEMVVITSGSEGAYGYEENKYYKIGTYQAKPVDATGAGDAFSAGFLGALLLGKNFKNALQYGVINSASVIEHFGAQSGLLKRKALENRLTKAPLPQEI